MLPLLTHESAIPFFIYITPFACPFAVTLYSVSNDFYRHVRDGCNIRRVCFNRVEYALI